MRYRSLNPNAIIITIETLAARVSERFGDRGLFSVAQELVALAREETGRACKIARPNYLLRLMVSLVLMGTGAVIAYGFQLYPANFLPNLAVKYLAVEPFSRLESLINILLLAFAGVYFLLSLESRSKRGAVLKCIHQLRSLAHVIDMHQLTKDPTVLFVRDQDTPSSPDRDLNAYELARYLEYCSEMFAIIGKLAAVYLEHIQDPVIIAAVNDLEALTSDLSRKVWQKIAVLEPVLSRQGETIDALGSAGMPGGKAQTKQPETASPPASVSDLPKLLS